MRCDTTRVSAQVSDTFVMPKLPKSVRILRQSEFDSLLKRGLKFGNAHFGVCWQKADRQRLGIAVSRKIKSAVDRNRIKRIVRETFRLNREKFPLGDLIVIAREGLSGLSSEAIRKFLISLLERKK